MVPHLTIPLGGNGPISARRPPPPQRTLVVEFVGLPGCGKTTVAQQVLPQLSARGVRCRGRRSPHHPWHERLRGYASTALFHLRHPGPVTAGVAGALTLSPLRLGRIPHALRMAAWARRFQQPRIGRHDLIVLDQGMIQDAWSLLLGAREQSNTFLARSILASVGKAAIGLAYVYFDTDVDLAVTRIRDRPSASSRLDIMPDTEARELLAAHRAGLARFFSLAVDVSGAPSCRIDASRPLEENTRRVLEFIIDVLAMERGQVTPHQRPHTPGEE